MQVVFDANYCFEKNLRKIVLPRDFARNPSMIRGIVRFGEVKERFFLKLF